MADLELPLTGTGEADLCAESSYAPRVNKLCAGTGSVKISRVLILNEIVRHLHGEISARSCESTANGFSSSLKISISGTKEETEPIEIIGCSNGYFCTEQEAADKAAEDLICSLISEFDIGIENLNWLQKDEDGPTDFPFRSRAEELKKENMLLKALVDLLINGWSYSLQLADSVCNMSDTAYMCIRSALSGPALDEDANFAVSNMEAFRDYTKRVWSIGTGSFRRAFARRQSIYEI